MSNRGSLHVLVWLCITLITLTSCSSKTRSSVKYYLIDPVAQNALPRIEEHQDNVESAPVAAGELRIQIIDVNIPQYLERFQIAQRVKQNQLTFSDSHQWAENLQKNLLRTMERNLSLLLDSADISTPVARSSSTPDYALNVFIEQFDQDPQGRVVLVVRYQVSRSTSQEVLVTARFKQVGSVTAKGNYADMIASMQAIYNALCVDIATSLIRLDELSAYET
jgi:uncharacterized lipoprotein YmbA